MAEDPKSKYGKLIAKRLVNDGGRKFFDSADHPVARAGGLRAAAAANANASASAAPASSLSNVSTVDHADVASSDASVSSPSTSPSSSVATHSDLHTPATSHKHHHPRHVLVIDHVEAARRISHVALTRAKFMVELASSSVDAQDKLKSCEAVLINSQLPELHPAEIAQQIRSSNPSTGDAASDQAHYCFIFAVGPPTPSDTLKADLHSAGWDGFISSNLVLSDALKKAIQARRAQPGEFVSML